MAHLARTTLVVWIGLTSSSCYLIHWLEDPADGAVDAAVDAPVSVDERTCCLALTCGGDAESSVCGAGAECGARGCDAACEGPRCAGSCCGAEQLCIADVCVDPGHPCVTDLECGPAETCDAVGRVCVPELATGCYASRDFIPEVQWEEMLSPAITVPLVAQLNDDDGDGRIDASDTPDIITIGISSLGDERTPPVVGRLVARSGDDGRTLWTAGDGLLGFCSHTTAAVGDLDADGTVEIVVLGRRIEFHRHVGDEPPWRCEEPPQDVGVCPTFPPDRGYFHDHGPMIDARFSHIHPETSCSRFSDAPGSIFILSHEGEVERRIQLPFVASERRTNTILIADLDADGGAEIIAGGVIVGAEGVRWSDIRLASVGIAVGDIDLDGRLEIVTAQHAFEHDGTLKWSDETIDIDGHPAIGRVLAEPASGPPQVIAVDGGRLVVRDGDTGRPLFAPARFGAGVSSGPPTLADFDGDGVAEIAVAGDYAFMVLDLELPAPHVRWEVLSQDRTPGTVGSAAFDFDGDGADDVAYSDECSVSILSGRDGTPLWTEENQSLTVWEYPVVADVDADGQAELIVVSNGRAVGCPGVGPGGVVDELGRAAPGLRIFRDRLGNWGPTRPTWNQHGYTRAIDGQGRIPVAPPRSWETHNSVRANPHLGERGPRLPNLGITAHRIVGTSCGADTVTLEARVENRGNVGVPAGVEVSFGSRSVGRTDRVLLPGGAAWARSEPLRRATLLSDGPIALRADPGDDYLECDEGDYIMQLELQCDRR